MKAWFEVKCCYGDCTAEAKIGGDDGKAGWELIGWFTKKWYCPKHGLTMMSAKQSALAYNTGTPTETPATPDSTLDELLAMI